MRFCTECKWAKVVYMGDKGNMVYCSRLKEQMRERGNVHMNRHDSLSLSFKKLSALACDYFEAKHG